MLFIVRGKNQNHDRVLRVRAETEKEAEEIGFKRGLFVTEVTPVADGADLGRLDKVADMLWKAWRAGPQRAMKCFGKPVSDKQVAALLMCGCTTWVLNLRMFGFV